MMNEAVLDHALLDYLTAARWFAGKGRGAELRSVTALPWLTEAAQWPAVRFEVAEVNYPDRTEALDGPEAAGEAELYQLALSYWPAPQPTLGHAEVTRGTDPELGPVVVYDAMQDPQAAQVILTSLLDQRSYGDPDTQVRFQLSQGDDLRTDLEPSVFTGQQSNTSVMFGEVAMLKLFRRLELGHNLDIEIHDSLMRAGVGEVATLFGWIEATWRHDDLPCRADLAMMVQKLAHAEDGWGVALASLEDGTDFTGDAAELGAALADIHRALQASFGIYERPGRDVADTMQRRLSKALGAAPALTAHVPALTACFAGLADGPLPLQRVHGDFHLGQTLRTPTGWRIIDFEGEPAKSLAERAEPDSVWRDIAGMLRSFDYAAASVPGVDGRRWATACRDAFLRGYAGGSMDATDQAALRAYEADKCVYEVVYEMRNRPDWVHIPLEAIVSITRGSSAPTTTSDDDLRASTPDDDLRASTPDDGKE